MSPLAVKAEVVLGIQLVTRHRAPRLTAFLALGVAALAAASDPAPARVARVAVLVAATLAAVSASRLLSPGPALAAARMVVAPWWLVPLGRLAGAACVVGPVTLGTALALAAASPQHASVTGAVAVAGVYSLSLAACTMALTPVWGASASAAVAFLAVWLGGAPPSAVASLFGGIPMLQRIVIWAWNGLPLPWRATRWLSSGGWVDPALLAVWTLTGLALAAVQLAGPRRGPREAGG